MNLYQLLLQSCLQFKEHSRVATARLQKRLLMQTNWSSAKHELDDVAAFISIIYAIALK